MDIVNQSPNPETIEEESKGEENQESNRLRNDPSNSNTIDQQILAEEDKKSAPSSSFMQNERDLNDNTSALIQLFHSYSNFINESSDMILDMDLVLDRLLDAINKLKPPKTASSHINSIWEYITIAYCKTCYVHNFDTSIRVYNIQYLI